MNVRTLLTLADGRNIDLLKPLASDFSDLAWAAEHLAKENRFNGATPNTCYSVAQHLCLGTDAVLMESGDRMLAAYFSLHDVHEALLKDDTTPKKRAFAAIAEEKFGVLATQVLSAFDELTDRHDHAIHEAAGLAWPPDPETLAAIKHFDQVMLVTEWRDLMGGHPLPNAAAYAGVKPLGRAIEPYSTWRTGARALVNRWRQLLPLYAQAA
jgi:hypothetical protein